MSRVMLRVSSGNRTAAVCVDEHRKIDGGPFAAQSAEMTKAAPDGGERRVVELTGHHGVIVYISLR